MILSPLIRLPGHSRSQETKRCFVLHLLISHPASLRIVMVVVTSIPLADWFHGFGPLTVGDTAGTAGAADRIRPSASGKVRSPPAPGQ